MSGIFHVTCFVKDTKLADVLRKLDGVAYNVSAVPARAESGGELHVRTVKVNGSAEDIFSQLPMKFTTRDLHRLVGGSHSYVHGVVKDGMAEKLIKRVKPGHYVQLKGRT
jgi:hypothetical protein